MKYYVDANGFVHDTMEVIDWATEINIIEKETHSEIQLIKADGYVFEEYVLWNSIIDLETAGVNCSSYFKV